MIDQLSIQRIGLLHPLNRQSAIDAITEIGTALTGRAMFRVTFTLRTFAEQAEIYKQGRTKPGPIVTRAKAGQSLHNYGLALDFAFVIDGKEASWDVKKDWDNDRQSDWMEVVAIFKKHGWEWGGDWRSFKDMPHFQKTYCHDWPDLLASVKAGKVDSQGYVLI